MHIINTICIHFLSLPVTPLLRSLPFFSSVSLFSNSFSASRACPRLSFILSLSLSLLFLPFSIQRDPPFYSFSTVLLPFYFFSFFIFIVLLVRLPSISLPRIFRPFISERLFLHPAHLLLRFPPIFYSCESFLLSLLSRRELVHRSRP